MSGMLTREEYVALCERACHLPAPRTTRTSTATARRARTQVFDFRRPNPVRRHQLRRLEALHEQLAHTMGGIFSTELRMPVQAELGVVQQLTFSEFRSALADASGSFLFRCPPLTGSCVLSLEPALANALLNRVFGGSGEPEAGVRELTSIERRGLVHLLDPLRTELEAHWHRAAGQTVRITAFEELPRLAEPSAPGETVISVSLALQLPHVSGILHLCYPHEMLRPLFVNVSAGSGAHPPGAMGAGERRAAVEHQLRRAHIPVSVRLAPIGAPLGRLASLRPGHIIELKYTETDLVQVLVHGQARYVAAIGHVGRRRAVSIHQPIS